jgi:putative ABC transport system ATP-binding protein
MALLEISQLQKTFLTPDNQEHVVVDVPHFALAEREQVALCGPSGSGKTTFLHLIAGILKPDRGRIQLGDCAVSSLAEPQRDRHRAQHIGYIFQTFNLLQGYTCLENVLLGMAFGGGEDRALAKRLLRRVGLAEHLRHRPRQLSSGQQQRVAVARALANRPQLVLADEPTGNLDWASGLAVLELVRETCREHGAALLLVSHDRDVLAEFETVQDLGSINRAAARSGGAS